MKFDKDFEKFYNKFKSQLPQLTNEQFQAILYYANNKLVEEKKKKLGQGKPETIIFNPVDSSAPVSDAKGVPSDAARSHEQYKKSNAKGK
jgi:uncharacterized phage-associated protein